MGTFKIRTKRKICKENRKYTAISLSTHNVKRRRFQNDNKHGLRAFLIRSVDINNYDKILALQK